MAARGNPKKIFIIAGESSGDILGADLMHALSRRLPGVKFSGVGGEEMGRIAGFKSLFDIRDIAVMGLFEVFRHIFTISRRIRQTAEAIARARPDMVITIDIPGFSMRVAKLVRRRMPYVPLVHYVAPSVWAWKESRAEKMAALYDALLCFFPFEAKYFRRLGLATHVVGHTSAAKARGIGARFRAAHGIRRDDTLITMLPGSRVQVAERLLPIFRRAAELLAARMPGIKIAIPTTATSREYIACAVADWPAKPILIEGRQARYDAFAASNAALSVSGTAVLELALMEVPAVAAYKMAPLTFAVAKRVVKLKHITLPNIIAGRAAVPEFIQNAATPENLARALLRFLSDRKYRARYVADARKLRAEISPDGRSPSERAAEAVAGMLRPWPAKLSRRLAALKILYEKTGGAGGWILTGSTSLILQGVVLPASNDIDILSTSAEARRIDRTLAGQRTRALAYGATERFRSLYGAYDIGGVNIDLMADMRYKTSAGWSKPASTTDFRTIVADGMRLRVLPLEAELAAYEGMGRENKAGAIRKAIRQKGASNAG